MQEGLEVEPIEEMYYLVAIGNRDALSGSNWKKEMYYLVAIGRKYTRSMFAFPPGIQEQCFCM